MPSSAQTTIPAVYYFTAKVELDISHKKQTTIPAVYFIAKLELDISQNVQRLKHWINTIEDIVTIYNIKLSAK